MVDALKLLFTYSLSDSLLFFLITLFIVKFDHPKSNPLYEKLCCLLFSLCLLSGCVIAQTNAFAELLSSARMILFYLLFTAAAYVTLCYSFNCLRIVFGKIMNHSMAESASSERQQLYTMWGIILICWLPYTIIRYPAGFEYDGYHQIMQFFDGTMTNHWPPASSVWMGVFVSVGQKIFDSTNIGIFLYCLLQTILGSFVFAYCLIIMKRLNVPYSWRLLSLLVFALIPVYPGYITSVVKDAPFSYMVLLFTLFYIQMVYKSSSISKKHMVLFIFSGFLMCILRNNGIFIIVCIVLAHIVVTLFRRTPYHTHVQISCLLIAFFVILYTKLLLPNLGIAPTSPAEALSVPFQQTARLASYRPTAISESDEAIIRTILDYDSIQINYNPKLADPVKATYHSTGFSDTARYFVVWAKEGVANPDLYIDAFLENAHGFYYPNIRMGNSNVVSGVYSSIYNTGSVQFPISEERMQDRIEFRHRISLIENLPFVFPFVNTAIQLWIPVYLLAMTISKKKSSFLLVLLPSIIGVLTCLASPTYDNNGARYALPVIYTNMLMIGIAKCKE